VGRVFETRLAGVMAEQDERLRQAVSVVSERGSQVLTCGPSPPGARGRRDATEPADNTRRLIVNRRQRMPARKEERPHLG